MAVKVVQKAQLLQGLQTPLRSGSVLHDVHATLPSDRVHELYNNTSRPSQQLPVIQSLDSKQRAKTIFRKAREEGSPSPEHTSVCLPTTDHSNHPHGMMWQNNHAARHLRSAWRQQGSSSCCAPLPPSKAKPCVLKSQGQEAMADSPAPASYCLARHVPAPKQQTSNRGEGLTQKPGSWDRSAKPLVSPARSRRNARRLRLTASFSLITNTCMKFNMGVSQREVKQNQTTSASCLVHITNTRWQPSFLHMSSTTNDGRWSGARAQTCACVWGRGRQHTACQGARHQGTS